MKYVYDELAIKAAMNIVDSLTVKGIKQAENIVKLSALLTSGEKMEEKEEK